MQQVNSIVVAFVCTVCLASQAAFGNSGAEMQADVPDIFKLYQMHPNGVAILDTDQDGDLECLTAERTSFDATEPAADYVWILKGLNGHPKRNITVHFKKGDAPDKALVTIDTAAGEERESRLIYTDYNTCAVFEIPYNDNTQCMLWATEEAKDNVPTKCTEQFRKNCEMEVIAYDKETCSQV